MIDMPTPPESESSFGELSENFGDDPGDGICLSFTADADSEEPMVSSAVADESVLRPLGYLDASPMFASPEQSDDILPLYEHGVTDAHGARLETAPQNLSQEELDQVAQNLSQYDGYPKLYQRLSLDRVQLRMEGTRLIVPDGSWAIYGHSNREGVNPERMDLEVPNAGCVLVDAELSDRWAAEGFTLDQLGRPIHPDWRQLLGDSRIGLPTGIGFFYRYGPNATVDPIVYRQHGNGFTEILLIKRERGEKWALPGGFKDREDASSMAAARREAGEETHLDQIGGTDELIEHRRSIGSRDTLHAWTENDVVLVHGNQEYLFDITPVPGDDAIDVGWFTRAQIGELDMFDAHVAYIDNGLRRLQRRN